MFQKFLWHLQDHLIDLVGAEDTGTDQERFVTITWMTITDFNNFNIILSKVFTYSKDNNHSVI